MVNQNSALTVISTWFLPFVVSGVFFTALILSERYESVELIIFCVLNSFLPTYLTIASTAIMNEIVKGRKKKKVKKIVFFFAALSGLILVSVLFTISCFIKTLPILIVVISLANLLLFVPSIALAIIKEKPYNKRASSTI